MRRSLLFIPGNNPGMVQNCDVFDSDSVIFDLEDAVSVQEKDSARKLVSSFLQSFNPNIEVVVRINGLDTPFYEDDLNTIVSEKIDAIMLPKARIADVKRLDELLSSLEKERNITKKIAIIPIIELCISLIEVDTIASLPRVDGILLGAEDLTKDLETTRTKSGEEIFYARAKIANSCKAYKIDAIDTPFTDTKDDEGLLKDASFSKRLGMNAKSAIHPNQIDTINKVYLPSEKEITWALRVIKAKEEAFAKGIGVFSLDGRMVDKPIIESAEKVIIKAKRYKVI